MASSSSASLVKPTLVEEILEFWFGKEEKWLGNLWWRGGPKADQKIANDFGNLVRSVSAENADLSLWLESSSKAIALILLLDQFPRNMYRGTKEMFFADSKTSEIITQIKQRKLHLSMTIPQRFFVNVALMHQERQARVVEAEKDLSEMIGVILANISKAEMKNDAQLVSREKYRWLKVRNMRRNVLRHIEMLQNFQRYPHRNMLLNRESTPEERSWLTKTKYGRQKADSVRVWTKRRTKGNTLSSPQDQAYASDVDVDDCKTTSHTAASDHVLEGRLKILVLHSFRQNSTSLRTKTKKLRAAMSKDAMLVYANAPHPYVPKKEVHDAAMRAFGSDFVPHSGHNRVWWNAVREDNDEAEVNQGNIKQQTGPTALSSPPSLSSAAAASTATSNHFDQEYQGLGASVQFLKNLFKREGPFDGVIGFSQGGAMVGLLSLLQQQQQQQQQQQSEQQTQVPADKESGIRFSFAVNISGFVPRNAKHGSIFKEMGEGKRPKIDLPSLHVYGAKDILVDSKRTLALANSFHKPEIVQHGGGHFVPSLWPTERIARFVALQRERIFKERREKEGVESGGGGVGGRASSSPPSSHTAMREPVKGIEGKLRATLSANRSRQRKKARGPIGLLYGLTRQSRIVLERHAVWKRILAARSSNGALISHQEARDFVAAGFRMVHDEQVRYEDARDDLLLFAFASVSRGPLPLGGRRHETASCYTSIERRLDTSFFRLMREICLQALTTPCCGLALRKDDEKLGAISQNILSFIPVFLTWSDLLRLDYHVNAVVASRPDAVGAGRGEKARSGELQEKTGATSMHRSPSKGMEEKPQGEEDGKESLCRPSPPPTFSSAEQLLSNACVSMVAEQLRADLLCALTYKLKPEPLPGVKARYVEGGKGGGGQQRGQLDERILACARAKSKHSVVGIDRRRFMGESGVVAVASGQNNRDHGVQQQQELKIGDFPSESAWACPQFRGFLDKSCAKSAHRIAELLYPLADLQRQVDAGFAKKREEGGGGGGGGGAEDHQQQQQQNGGRREEDSLRVAKGIQRNLYRAHCMFLKKILFASTPEFMDMKKSLYAQAHNLRARRLLDDGEKGSDGEVWEMLSKKGLSQQVLRPTPEPVIPCAMEQLRPLLTHIDNKKSDVGEGGGKASATSSMMQFPRGTIMADGRLDLCKQVVGPQGISPLLDSLIGSKGITRLLLGNNIVGNGGAEAIAAAINNPSCPLTTWYIAGNEIDAKGIKPICQALAKNTQVDQLWLKRNPLLPAGALEVSWLLKQNQTLTVLDLVNCGILDDGIKALMDGLRSNRAMKHVYLGTNGITAKGAVHVSEFLQDTKKKTSLHTLYLSCNRLGDEGARILGEGLRKDNSLQRLGLAANRIRAKGLKAIADAVRNHPTLKKLDVGYVKAVKAVAELGNRIEDDGAKILAELIKTNETLRSIDCIHNRITERGLTFLRESLEKNSSLTSLDCVQFGIYNELTYERIRHCLKRNRNALIERGEATANSLEKINQPQHQIDILSVYRTK